MNFVRPKERAPREVLILVLEPDAERYGQLVFLLRLAGFGSRRVKTAEEALNWIGTCPDPDEELLCLLISLGSAIEQVDATVGLLQKFAFPLPLVVVNRFGAAGERLFSAAAQPPVLTCVPTAISATLERLRIPAPWLRSDNCGTAPPPGQLLPGDKE